MADIIVIAVLAVVVGAAVRYIYKSRKSGRKCIGCPHSGDCCQNSCSCSSKKA